MQQQEMDEFVDGQLYDLFYSGVDFSSNKDLFKVEKDLYKSISQSNPGNILEVCCGTGIFIIDLANRIDLSLKKVGVDFSHGMISFAKTKNGSENIDWHVDDVTNINLNEKFSFILCPGNAYQAFISTEKQQAYFKKMSELLTQNGKLLFTMRTMKSFYEQNQVTVGQQFTKKVPDYWKNSLKCDEVQQTITGITPDQMQQTILFEKEYNFLLDNRSVKKKQSQITLRYSGIQETLSLCKNVGLEVCEIWGGYDCRETDNSTDEVIFLLNKA